MYVKKKTIIYSVFYKIYNVNDKRKRKEKETLSPILQKSHIKYYLFCFPINLVFSYSAHNIIVVRSKMLNTTFFMFIPKMDKQNCAPSRKHLGRGTLKPSSHD